MTAALAFDRSTDRIASIALDEKTIIMRNDEVEKEREVALRDLVEENEFRRLLHDTGDAVQGQRRSPRSRPRLEP